MADASEGGIGESLAETAEELAGVVAAIIAGVCVIAALDIGSRVVRRAGGRMADRHPLLTELMAFAARR
ncbi:MAG: hypothetical protein AB7O78_05170 [Thermoleophilia bacterium]